MLATITRLKLNDHDCPKVREEYATAFSMATSNWTICGGARRFWQGKLKGRVRLTPWRDTRSWGLNHVDGRFFSVPDEPYLFSLWSSDMLLSKGLEVDIQITG